MYMCVFACIRVACGSSVLCVINGRILCTCSVCCVYTCSTVSCAHTCSVHIVCCV